MTEPLLISEVYGPVIQGEGDVIGEPSLFVRAAVCDYRCSWCDSLHAVDVKHKETWVRMSSDEVLAEIARLARPPMLITLTGGNPALQDFSEIIMRGKQAGYRFLLETQGSVWKDYFDKLDQLVLSPKAPSSSERPDLAKLDKCVYRLHSSVPLVMKIVVFDSVDYAFACEIRDRYSPPPNNETAVYGRSMQYVLQVGHVLEGAVGGVLDRTRWLSERVLADVEKWPRVRVLPQLHYLLYRDARGK
jgi:7-carboxy-7-deazaguanine synthase